jgi:NAD+ synthase (glutamine-hydrolysing)
LKWARVTYEFPVLGDVLEATPTAELRPLDISGKSNQSDETEIGFSYEEINLFGRLRKTLRHGPLSMFSHLNNLWNKLPAIEVASKVKKFFVRYSQNRHKATVMTPALHMQPFSIDDNRNDLRPFLYNNRWECQFRAIDRRVLDLRK